MNPIPSLHEVLESKGIEYAPFDPDRAKRIYAQILPHITLPSRIIHIIGTNGKGSTGRFIAMGLEQNQKSVLHFSSPHLFDFKERFYTQGGDIEDSRLEEAHIALWQIESVRESSYFEYATFLALYVSQGCEYLVLEAGLGGEFDSTSVCQAHLSVFTSIGYDHQEMLGESLEMIASTKLRAMRGRAILAKQPYAEVVVLAKAIATQKGVVLDCWESGSICEGEKMLVERYLDRYDKPFFLGENIHTAIRVLAEYGMKFDFSSLPPLSLRGRGERLSDHITLDVGHNLDGARVLKTMFSGKKVNLVYNAYDQKDVKAILSELLPIIKRVFILSVENPRICPRARIECVLRDLSIPYDSFDVLCLDSKEPFLVFGSFSVVCEFLRQYDKYHKLRV